MPSSPSEFAAAVGLRSPLRVVFEHRGRNRPAVVELAEPYALLGSSQECDVRLPDPTVSKCHVYLQAFAGGLYAVDLNSRYGMHADGAKWSQVWLHDGQVLKVGAYDVQAAGGGEPGERPLPTEAEGADPPAFALAVIGDAAGPLRCPLRHPLTLIGRSAECNLRLIDPRVRSLHAAVVRTPTDPWLVNLRSMGAVRLNGELVRAARLSAGDQIGLNGITLEVRPNWSALPRPVPAAAPVEPPVALTALPGANGHADLGQFALVMANVFTALQEQMRLTQRQNELLEDIRDAVRGGRVREGEPDAGAPHQLPANAPPPQVPRASGPEEASALSDAHDWLLSRLGRLGDQG